MCVGGHDEPPAAKRRRCRLWVIQRRWLVEVEQRGGDGSKLTMPRRRRHAGHLVSPVEIFAFRKGSNDRRDRARTHNHQLLGWPDLANRNRVRQLEPPAASDSVESLAERSRVGPRPPNLLALDRIEGSPLRPKRLILGHGTEIEDSTSPKRPRPLGIRISD